MKFTSLSTQVDLLPMVDPASASRVSNIVKIAFIVNAVALSYCDWIFKINETEQRCCIVIMAIKF